MKCKHCKRKIEIDQDKDLIHSHLDMTSVDPRMCEPSNPDSKIAEEYILPCRLCGKTIKHRHGGMS